MKHALLFTLVACAVLLWLAPVQAQTYKLTDTGHVGDNITASGTAYSISPTGEVGGQSSPTFNYGYRWKNGAITQLDDVKNASGFTYVNGINNAGVAVGSCADYFSPDDRFVRWNGTAATDLGSVGDGKGDGQAFAINDNGLIVGTSFDAYYGHEHAVTYDTAFHLLPYLAGAPADAYAEAHAVNASGEAAGWCTASDGEYHATLWKGGKAYDLGLFGGTRSQAEGMNDVGQVVGFYQAQPNGDGTAYNRAFLWTPTTTNGTTGTMQDIGVLPGGTEAYARDINNNGQIVGYSFSASAAGYAFVWDAAHGMRDLTKLITSISTEVQPNNNNYYLKDAHAINDAGQIAADFVIFVSNGSSDHVEHGCVLTPAGGTTAAKAKTLTFTPNPVVGGQNATGTVTLTAAAPAGGAAVTITENGTAIGSITVPAGATSTTFTLNTSAVTAAETDSFGAVYGGATVTTTLTITPATAAAPVINSLAPAAATAGGGAFTLTVNGTNFASNSVVKWNGATQTTTFASSTKLTASIAASLIAAAGTASVTVTTPHVGTSAAKTFTINPATASGPVLTSVTPSTRTAGGGAFVLTANGTGFVSGSLIKWNGATQTTTYVSSTKLTASIAASLIVSAGTASITVTTPHVGTSGSQTVTVSAAAGAATLSKYTFSPNPVTGGQTTTGNIELSGPAPAGGANVTITYNGAYFYAATVPAGQSKVSYSQPTSAVTSVTPYAFTATYNGKSLSKTLTVNP